VNEFTFRIWILGFAAGFAVGAGGAMTIYLFQLAEAMKG